MHIPVLLNEAVEALNIKEGGIYVDGTYGRGGHSQLILSHLGEAGRLIAFDKDPVAIVAAKAIHDSRFSVVHSSYAELEAGLQMQGIARVDGVLLDLGVSSGQLDEAERGFSFRNDGPLDMRMDTSQGITAATWLAEVTEAQLKMVIRDYGEERYAGRIARAIIAARIQQSITSTKQLAQIVAAVVPARGRKDIQQHPATRTFQAIRIYVNRELEDLSAALPQCVNLLNTFGRLVVISFHSLEDRIVKRFVRSQTGIDRLPRKLPVREIENLMVDNVKKLRTVGKKIRPSAQEVLTNPRARSAIMRVAERLESPSACSKWQTGK